MGMAGGRTKNFTEVLLADRHRHCSGHCGAGPVPLSLLQACSWFSAEGETSHQHVLFWGGLRGALGPALSLAAHHTPLPRRRSDRGLRRVAYPVIVQGLRSAPLMRASARSDRPAPDNLERPLLRPSG